MRPLLSLAASLLAASAAAAPAEPDVLLRTISPHQAARLIGELYRSPVIAVGGADEPVSLDLVANDAEEALKALARVADLSVAREGKVLVLAPADTKRVPATLPWPPKLRGAPVDLDFYRADAPQVVRLLATVMKLQVQGAPPGELSMRARGVPVGEILSAIVALAGGAKLQGATLVFADEAELRAPGSASPVTPCPPKPGTSPFSLACVELSDLAVCAIAGHRERRVAMLRPSKQPTARGQLVRTGDTVGKGDVKVLEVGAQWVHLDGGVRLGLPLLTK